MLYLEKLLLVGSTFAKSLAIGNPADGYFALKVLEESKGSAYAVREEDVVQGIKDLAEMEGIFTEPAGGVVVATLKHLAHTGQIKPWETTVAFITGNGYKTSEVVATTVPKPITLGRTLSEFEAFLTGR